MPETEPKPRLIELVAPGQGQGWKAVLKNGHPVVIHEIPVPAAEAAAAVPRIQRLADHRHPALSPILAWGTDPNGIWVAVEPNEGTPLGTILTRGPLTPPAAAALGAAVLSGVAALHEAGIAMGGFGAAAIRVTGNGEVRLAGHPAAAIRGAPAQSDLRADVRSCGMAVCAAFGVDPAGAPAPPNVPPGLVVTMRSMASGAMGPAADRAQGALREMASALLAPDRMVAAQSELALRAGGRETPGVTPFLPATPAQPAPAPAPPAPTPYVPPVPHEDTPVRTAVSYEPPPRSMQTYPSVPAPTFAPQAPTPDVPAPGPSQVPTWSEVPPRNATSYDAPPGAASTTPPAPAAPAPAAPAAAAPAPATWEAAAPSAPAPSAPAPPAPAPSAPAPLARDSAVTRSPFQTAVPAASTATNPPAPAPVPAPPAPAAAQQTWAPVETPAWTPGPAGGVLTPPAETTSAPAPSSAYVTTPPAPARQPSVARKPAGGGMPTQRPAWMIPAIIAVVLILLLGVGGTILLLGRGNSPGATAGHSPSPKTSPKASASPSPSAPQGPLAVPNYGPATAAPVTGIAFLTDAADTSCAINGSCKVTVEMKFSTPQHTDVAYTLKFFDRCTGTTTDLPGNHFTPPGFTRVDITSVVSLPTGAKSAAIVAVSTTPAVSASAPLLLGSDSCA
jgi:hypothetical protein